MRIVAASEEIFEELFRKIIDRGRGIDESIVASVTAIVKEVEQKGDEALFRYTRQFDGIELDGSTVEIPQEDLDGALHEVEDSVLDVLSFASERIRRYHERQIAGSWFDRGTQGEEMGQLIRPIERVGIYAPGGLAPYPSTVLMASIPANLAGVREIILVTPARGGTVSPLIRAAARIGGVHRAFKIGGAQAVAALAYGTKSIPRVDKIVGPGNIYVAVAKKLVFGAVGIDMIAGPSEIIVVADESADPAVVAADLLSQAEHDAMASAIVVTTCRNVAEAVVAEVAGQLALLPRKSIAGEALENYGIAIVAADLDEALALADRFAPEHLELIVENPRACLEKVRNAGAVFLGGSTPEALGDYCAGSNHILPTGGTARFSSPLGVYDFIKRTSVLHFSPEALDRIGPAAVSLARLEGLEAHARSVEKRLRRR